MTTPSSGFAAGAEFFGVLVVCTGNVCRSPATERLLLKNLDRATPWAFALGSSGTAALVGQPIHPLTVHALAAHGVDGRGHVARNVTEAQLAQADLVLTATRAHRIPLVGLHPPVRARTFTLREFARLASVACTEARTPWELVRVVSSLRGSMPPPHPTDDDIADPVNGDFEDHVHAVGMIAAATAEIAASLRKSVAVHVPDEAAPGSP